MVIVEEASIVQMNLVEHELGDIQVPIVPSRCWDNVSRLDHIWFQEVFELDLLVQVRDVCIVIFGLSHSLNFVIELKVMVSF